MAAEATPLAAAAQLIAVGIVSLVVIRLIALWDKKRYGGAAAGMEHPPGLRPYPIIGHLPQFLANRHRIADWQVEILAAAPTNTIVLHRLGNIGGVISANPDNIEYALRHRFDNFPKGRRLHDILDDFLGRGIFNSDGERWRVQRKTASFEFNTRSLRAFVARCVNHEVDSRLLPLLRRAALDGRVVDLQDALERFAFDTVCMVAFDFDPHQLNDGEGGGDDATAFANAFRDASNISAARFRYTVPWFWRVKRSLRVGSEKRLADAVARVRQFSDDIIKSRRKELADARGDGGVNTKQDLLSRFMVSEDEHYTDDYLRDIVTSFVLAGRATTSSALSWFFWHLSSHPGVLGHIRQEISASRSASDAFDLDGLREMHYLHAALTESMRLYPPVPFSQAELNADDVLPDGTVMKKGWFFSYNTYAMGRMKTVWGKDATEFKPQRWLDAGGAFKPESPYRYPIFHGGPRMCLGKEMAYIQMKSVAACIIAGFDVEVVSAAEPYKEMGLTLRMRDGLPVKLKPTEE